MGCSSSELSLGSLRPYSHLRQTWLGCTSTPVFELGDRTSAKCLIREEICSGRWGRGTLGVGNPCHFRESMRTIRETRRLSWPCQQGLVKIEHDLSCACGSRQMKAGFGSIRENLAKQHWFAHSYSVNRDRGHKVHGRVVLCVYFTPCNSRWGRAVPFTHPSLNHSSDCLPSYQRDGGNSSSNTCSSSWVVIDFS